MAESLRSFFDELEAPDRHLVLLNRSSPDPVRNLLDSLLDGQPVSVSEAEADTAADDDVVALVEDGSVVARSTLDELLESVLLINSDLYKSGAIELDEVALPAVFEGLDEVPFRVRGYPASNKEKLLLIVVSRVIERIAAEHGGGTLRASFQRLSRIDDERGTRDVYERVAGTGVDVHVYGVGDVESLSGLPVTVHTGTSYPYRRSWFVVFTPLDGGDGGDHVALLALEDEPNVWDGFWTFRPELVTRIERYIAEEV
ncbi:DICT sensory domain-containing protein [Halorubrum sp. Atlit-26R]|uniref:DICT sensory domain-containing protein n=1 Tax=Halorubrum sp. Atlit-26R TaxID=2282128 RepID=UPI000EF22538|nr:DICT sensory domain-containing protein [Halorubrum sp. Atlit-26R]RLM70531.1 histidine kinase [Halorubrum sp. Atlit-26R]